MPSAQPSDRDVPSARVQIAEAPLVASVCSNLVISRRLLVGPIISLDFPSLAWNLQPLHICTAGTWVWGMALISLCLGWDVEASRA